MAGLFDFNYEDPQQVGQYGFAAGLLNAAGPSRMPVSTGQAIAQGLMLRQQQAAEAMQNQRRNQLIAIEMQQHQMLLDQARRQQAEQDQARALMQQYVQTPAQQAGSLPGGPTMANAAAIPKMPGGFDADAMRMAAMRSGNLTGVDLASKLAKPAITPLMMSKGQVAIDPRTFKTLATNPEPTDPNKPFMMVNGQMVPNPAYQQYELSKARAGASTQSVNVNTMLPFKTELQKKMAENLAADQTKYATAADQIDNFQKARSLIPQAAPFVGSQAEKKLAAVKFLNNNFGLGIDPKAVAASGELQTRLFYQIMENLKKMDAQPSQQQQQMMRDALGNLDSDPGALSRILQVAEDSLRAKVGAHNTRVQQFSSQPDVGPLPYDLTVKLPEPAAPGSSVSSMPGTIDFNSLPKRGP